MASAGIARLRGLNIEIQVGDFKYYVARVSLMDMIRGDRGYCAVMKKR